MPSWMSGLTVAEVAGVVAVLVVLAGVIRKTVPVLRRIGHLVDDLAGEPARPGVDARPSLMERVAEVESLTRTVHKEVLPNGGASMRDEISRATAGIQAAHDRIDQLTEHLDGHMGDSARRDRDIDRILGHLGLPIDPPQPPSDT